MKVWWYKTPRCAICNKFCVVDDQETPYGCPDPEYPEPFEPTLYCAKCFDKHKEEWRERLTYNHSYGHWQKSRAEKEVAQELGLIWIGSEGIGKYSYKNMVNHLWRCHCYVTREEYNRLNSNV